MAPRPSSHASGAGSPSRHRPRRLGADRRANPANPAEHPRADAREPSPPRGHPRTTGPSVRASRVANARSPVRDDSAPRRVMTPHSPEAPRPRPPRMPGPTPKTSARTAGMNAPHDNAGIAPGQPSWGSIEGGAWHGCNPPFPCPVHSRPSGRRWNLALVYRVDSAAWSQWSRAGGRLWPDSLRQSWGGLQPTRDPGKAPTPCRTSCE